MRILIRSRGDALAYAIHDYGLTKGKLLVATLPDRCFGHGFRVECVERGDFQIIVDGLTWWVNPVLVEFVIDR